MASQGISVVVLGKEFICRVEVEASVANLPDNSIQKKGCSNGQRKSINPLGLPPSPPPLVFEVRSWMLDAGPWSLEDLAFIDGEEFPSVSSPGLVDSRSDRTFKYLLYSPVAKG